MVPCTPPPPLQPNLCHTLVTSLGSQQISSLWQSALLSSSPQHSLAGSQQGAAWWQAAAAASSSQQPWQERSARYKDKGIRGGRGATALWSNLCFQRTQGDYLSFNVVINLSLLWRVRSSSKSQK